MYLSLAPGLDSPVIVSGRDKVAHLFAYAVLMFWFMQIVSGTSSRLAAATGLVSLGIALEVVQAILPYRTFELLDIAANTLGVGLGWLAAPPRSINVLAAIESIVSN